MKRNAITSDQMYRIEENGHSTLGMRRFLMMENAGHGVADFVAARFKGRFGKKKIVAVCGAGNNGGDGFVAARHLAGYGPSITIVLLGSPNDIKSEEATVLARELAALSGESLTTAVTVAVRERLERLRAQRAERADRLLEIGRDVASRLSEPYRTADHGDLLYDDRGLPRRS